MRDRKEIEILIRSQVEGFVSSELQKELFDLLFDIRDRLPKQKDKPKQDPLIEEELKKFNEEES